MATIESSTKILLMIEPSEDKFFKYSTALKTANYEIKRAMTALEALKIIDDSTAPIQLILLDWLLPDVSGYALIQKLRGNERLAATQFLVCTTAMSDEDLVLLGELDIYHWFNANSDPNILLGKITALNKDYTSVSVQIKNIRQFEQMLMKENIDEAKTFLEKNDLEKAIRELPRYHYCLGEYFILLRKAEAAVELLKNSVKAKQQTKGDNIRNLSMLGKAYCLLGKHQDALSIFRKLTAKSPKNLSHKILLGDVHLGMNQGDEARKQYQDVLKADASQKDALVGMAKADIAENNMEGAKSFFAQIKEPFESYTLASFFNNRAVALTKDKKAEEAIVLYENAIQFLKKYRGHVYFNLGNAYTRLGQTEKAAEAYKKAAQLAPPELLSKKSVLRKLSDHATEDFVSNPDTSKKTNFSV